MTFVANAYYYCWERFLRYERVLLISSIPLAQQKRVRGAPFSKFLSLPFFLASSLLSSLELSDTEVVEPQMRARLGTAESYRC